jgi:hypothetical protein
MADTSLEEGLKTRTDDLVKLWELLKVRVPFTDARRTKIENYIAEVPVRVRRREGYEALFALTRVATMLGEVRIEYRGTERRVEDGVEQRDTVECSPEETPSNVHSIK